MLFNSLEFIVFFFAVTALYFSTSPRYRWVLLLVSSCYFYMRFIPVYILILAFTIIVDYFAGLLIERSEGGRRKFYLIVSIAANVVVLGVFKYYNFFIENISGLLGSLGFENRLPYLSILLPIGLSFHTFQAMSYNIEVFRGNQQAEKHFGIYALYVMFYPQLVAGPIERPQNMLPQFRKEFDFEFGNVSVGLKRILWGLFKKVVIADRLGVYVDTVFANHEAHSAVSLVLAAFFFSFQIYCDFSGYSDIAIGTARVMGFKLMENFRRPYMARSVREFWQRWHISLSSWFKDYIYKPMGGNRVSRARWYINIFIIFMLSGFWHGADWTFIAWGLVHGSLYVFGLLVDEIKKRVPLFNIGIGSLTPLYHITATFALVSLARIFFRAPSIEVALSICESIFTLKPGGLFIGNPAGFAYSMIWILLLVLVEYCIEYRIGFSVFNHRSPVVRFAGYALIVVCILLFGVFNQTQFIYFQF